MVEWNEVTYGTVNGGQQKGAVKAQGGETELCWIQSSNEAEVKELTTGVVVLRCRDPTLAFNATHRMLLNLCEGGSWIIDPLPPCQPLDAWQEEFLDLKNDSAAKDAFQNMELEEFWTLVRGTYPLLATNALRILVQFSSTYLCETGFSALVHLKTKARSKLEVEAYLRSNDAGCAIEEIGKPWGVVLREEFTTTQGTVYGRYYECQDSNGTHSSSVGLTQCINQTWSPLDHLDCPAPQDCSDLSNFTPDSTPLGNYTGVFTVYPSGRGAQTSIQVWCEEPVENSDQVWTTIMSLPFNSTFDTNYSSNPHLLEGMGNVLQLYTDNTTYFIGERWLWEFSRHPNGSERPLLLQPVHGLVETARRDLQEHKEKNVTLWTARIRPQHLDIVVSCPLLNVLPYTGPDVVGQWDGFVPLSRAPGDLLTYRCLGEYSRPGGGGPQEGQVHCQQTDIGPQWNGSLALPCQLTCPANYQISLDHTTCYLASSDTSPHGVTSASLMCAGLGGSLAVLVNAGDLPAVLNSSQQYLIAHRASENGTSPPLPADFNCSQPSCMEEGCVSVTSEGQYAVQDCSSSDYHFLCQVPAECPVGWKEQIGLCYLLTNIPAGVAVGRLRWAQEKCEDRGGSLAFPESRDVLAFLAQMAREEEEARTGAPLTTPHTILLGLNDVSKYAKRMATGNNTQLSISAMLRVSDVVSATTKTSKSNSLSNFTMDGFFAPDAEVVAEAGSSEEGRHWRELRVGSASTNYTTSLHPIDISQVTATVAACQLFGPEGCWEAPPEPGHNMIRMWDNNNNTGNIAVYKCQPGYIVGRNGTTTEQWVRCLGVAGGWVPISILDCYLAQVCLPPPYGDGWNVAEGDVGSNLTFSCPTNMSTAAGNTKQTLTCTHTDSIMTYVPNTFQPCDGKEWKEMVWNGMELACLGGPWVVNADTDWNATLTWLVGTVVSATCHTHHFIQPNVTNNTLACTSSGWETLYCYPVCPDAPPVPGENMEQMEVMSNEVGTRLTYTCTPGYYLQPLIGEGEDHNQTLVECSPDHTWNVTRSLICLSRLSILSFLRISGVTKTPQRSTGELTCRAQLTLLAVAIMTTTTLEDTPAQTPQRRVCFEGPPRPTPSSNTFSTWDGYNRTVGTQVNYTCAANQTFEDMSEVVVVECEEGGNWSHSNISLSCRTPQKLPIACVPPPFSPSESKDSQHECEDPSVCTRRWPGRALYNQSPPIFSYGFRPTLYLGTIICVHPPWVGGLQVTTCPTPGLPSAAPQNASVVGAESPFFIGDSVVYMCPSGMESWNRNTSYTITCSDSGWTNLDSSFGCYNVCLENPPQVPYPGVSDWNHTTRILRTEVTLFCPTNYTFTNFSRSLTFICNEDGNWTESPPELLLCRQACPSLPPPAPANTTLAGPDRDPPYWEGSRVWYQCEAGLSTQYGGDAVSLTCSVNSGWGQLDIQCEPACPLAPFPYDLTSSNMTSAGKWGITYGYWCEYGFYEQTGGVYSLFTTCVEGNWTRTHIPKCIALYCMQPPSSCAVGSKCVAKRE
ncbi:hypothetical protein Pmani_000364 [Petrolisthes manimaculis]|uniref:Sushi domain-containing protein n=1 Tax=Petrolisthes manimaculis TaxID=1843537 RepID=A0AAE1USV4_9EUCA|nr:hypothetical protein Pmani_000364 [Petrolisthes manimaculis]